MRILQKYVSTEICRSVAFVLAAFLALFAFFDLIGELPSVGKGNYQLHHAFMYIALGMPGYVYELMPIAALIGTIYALAQFAASSEFTVMRVSSMSTRMVGWMLAQIGVVFLIITFLFGEVLSPVSSEWAEKLKLRTQGTSVSSQFRSGLWAKDVIRENGTSGSVIGSRFLNVRELRPDGQLLGVKVYELDRDFHLMSLITASRADYQGDRIWRLSDVSETRFPTAGSGKSGASDDITANIVPQLLPTRDMLSEITPDILSVLFTDPDRMSAYHLSAYTKHLAENKQRTERYEIAFWKKLIYPFAVFVMLALALPFAYLHFRAGGVSFKIFTGIMIGVSFQLINSLFSHLGLLNTWPALVTALLPSALYLTAAIAALFWVERH